MKKFLTSLIIFGLSCICFCSSDYNGYSFIQTGINSNSYGFSFARNGGRSVKILSNTQTTGYVCFNYNYFSANSSPAFYLFACDTDYSDSYNLANQSDCTNLGEIVKITDNNSWSSGYYCYTVSGKPYLFVSRGTSTSNTINFYYKYYYYIPSGITLDNIQSFTAVERDCSSCDYSGYILESDVTKNYCTNKYSDLIPEEDITQGYCETQFGLISPSDCPSGGTGSGTGSIMWSSFFVNDRQILGGENIYLYIPDFLSWDYTYVDGDLQVDVINEGDEQYIEDILTVQSYHPSSEDFTVSFVGFLTLVLPYALVVLFCVFIFKLIKKIFKS